MQRDEISLQMNLQVTPHRMSASGFTHGVRAYGKRVNG